MAQKPEKIKVKFNGKIWEFDYAENLSAEHFKKALSQEVPEIATATVSTSYEDEGKVKVFNFEKALKYKG